MKIEQLTRKNLVVLAICIGFVQIAAYYVAGVLASGEGSMATPQPDTLLYCQAARRITEGHPFSFSQDVAACTGTTSVLYPFLLAIPHLLGFRGPSLMTGGFLLNALFYLIALGAWTTAFTRWILQPLPRLVGVVLLGLSGMFATGAFGQSDIGLWMATSGLFAMGLATQNRSLYGSMLLLGPWVRPEGMICAIAFLSVLVCRTFFVHFYDSARHAPANETPQTADWVFGISGILSTLGVFGLNFALTGHAQFSSVAQKGYFTLFPFASALHQTLTDMMTILRDHVFGLSLRPPRHYHLLPFLGAILLWIGVFRYQWKHPGVWRLLIFLLAIGGGIFTVAQSGWQGSNLDRYLCWILPTAILFVAEGLTCLQRRIPQYAMKWLPAVVLVIHALSSTVGLLAIHHIGARHTDAGRQFGCACDKAMPPKASWGTFSQGGLSFSMKPRRLTHLSGIYSPELSAKTIVGRMEQLRNDPSLRFDYWLIKNDDDLQVGEGITKNLGESILTGPNGFSLLKANWTPFEDKPTGFSGKKLMDRVDVAHEADEIHAHYEPIMRYGLQPFDPILHVDDLKGKTHIDGGRVLYGGDEMTVNLTPGKDVTVVMRTYSQQKIAQSDGINQDYATFAFANPLRLHVAIDGEIATLVEVKYADKGFTDATFMIPGTAITKSPCRVAFLGDHISCGYWFYQ